MTLEPLLSEAQACAYLNIPIKQARTLRRLCVRARDPVPWVKIGRHRKFPPAALAAWVARQGPQTRPAPFLAPPVIETTIARPRRGRPLDSARLRRA